MKQEVSDIEFRNKQTQVGIVLRMRLVSVSKWYDSLFFALQQDCCSSGRQDVYQVAEP